MPFDMPFLDHHPGRKDVLFCCIVLLFAFLVQQGRTGASVNGIYLSTDAAQYCSIAAAMGQPQAFAHDDAYSDPEALRVHSTLMVDLTRWLAPPPDANGSINYGVAYLRLTGLHVALHAITFYLLGLALFRRRDFAAGFAVVFQQAYWIDWGTYFGCGYLDYTPRTTFEVFYPLYICAALALLHTDRRRYPHMALFMALLGLMVYVHSISTLPVAIGFLLGFLWARPEKVPRQRHFWLVCVSGLAFCAVIAPFVLKFLRHGVSLTADDVNVLRETLLTRYDPEFAHYWAGMAGFFWYHTKLPLFPLAAAGAWLVRRHGLPHEKAFLTQMAWWCVGVLVVVVAFVVDQELARVLKRHHYEFDCIRVLRFLVFFAYCAIFTGALVLLRRSRERRRRWAGGLVVLLFVTVTLCGDARLTTTSLAWYWNVADPARYATAYAPLLRRERMITALATHTPPGASIFYPLEDQAIRHNAQRALVYGWKDASIFYYAKQPDKLRRWNAITHALAASPTAYIDVAREIAADYILSHRPEDLPLLRELGAVVWQGEGFVLVKKGLPTTATASPTPER